MTQVHRFELHIDGQRVPIPLDNTEVVAPSSLTEKIFRGGSESSLSATEKRANRTNTSWTKISHSVKPQHYESNFICPVLLKHENQTLKLVAYNKSDQVLFERHFFDVSLEPGLQFMYQPTDAQSSSQSGSGFLITGSETQAKRLQPSLKQGGPILEDTLLGVHYVIEPKLLKPKNQGPNNFVAGRFLVLVRLVIAMQTSLLTVQ